MFRGGGGSTWGPPHILGVGLVFRGGGGSLCWTSSQVGGRGRGDSRTAEWWASSQVGGRGGETAAPLSGGVSAVT